MRQMSAASDRQYNLALGIPMTVAEISLMVCISSLVKAMSSDLDILTILMFRYALSVPFLFCAGLYRRGSRVLHVAQVGTLSLRCAAGLAGLSCYYLALEIMMLAQVMTLFQTTTLFVTFFAPILLGEKIGWQRWSAVLAGFAGVVILLEPGSQAWQGNGIFYAIGAPLFGAFMLILLRKLGSDHPVSTAIWYNSAGAVLFAIVFLFRDVPWPQNSDEFIFLLVIGAISSLQQFLIAASHVWAPASILAPLRYIGVPLAVTVGIIFFGETPDRSFSVGASIIIISLLFILWREKKRVRINPHA